jgi:DNA-directed RNA polymerase subunit RPC12/RpoP
MELPCIHCGQRFSVRDDQLGGRGRCPHCRGEIVLPKASSGEKDRKGAPVAPFHWLENSISGLASVIFHTALFLALALFEFGHIGGEGEGTDVLIGALPSEQLSNSMSEELSAEDEAKKDKTSAELDETLEIQSPSAATDSALDENLIVASPSPSGGDAGSFDLGDVTIGGGGSMAGGGSWDGMISTLKRHGLDVVIVFDSTGSMGGEIEQVKSQIKRIGTTLLTIVPKARISLCAYRDLSDEYVTKGLPLTSNVQEMEYFLQGIRAGGGGDVEEAVQEGLRWAVQNNQFRTNARKVILVFGDAPPHAKDKQACLRVAGDFASQNKGIVSTVTCRNSVKLPEFVEIAQAGGGEAFLTADERQIVTQLLVLVFGSKYRDKVLEAFKLLEK